jgi:hypothetical protein
VNATEPTRSFKARALAQAHPLSSSAHRYVNAIVARERIEQPQAEIGIWAGNALTIGYCLRKLEEVESGGSPHEINALEFDDADSMATRIATDIRTSEPDLFLLDPKSVVQSLDELIAGEIDRRLDHWKGTVTDETWAELEEYIAWWVIKGYSLRVAESRRHAT